MRVLKLCFLLSLFTTLAWGQKDSDLYDLDQILEVKIYFEEENWESILDSLKQAGEDDRLQGEVTVNGTAYKKVGIRYKGNSSYNNPRKNGGTIKFPFNIKIDYKKKKQHLPGKYETLKLSNGFRDPSFLREVLAYEIAGKYMPAPKANFAKVYVNDQYIGLYNSTQSIDDLFLKNYYGNEDGAFFKCDPVWNAPTLETCPKGEKSSLMYLGEDSICYMKHYELKSKYGWSDLIELSRTLNKKPKQIEEILDVNQTLWMLAFNSVLVNLDSYTGRLCHNYYIYRDTAGTFHTLVWDMNLAFGGFRYLGLNGRPLTLEAMQTMSPFEHYKQKNPKRPLITNLLSEGLYRKIYVAHIRTILNDFFVDGTFEKRAAEIQALIDEHVQADENRLYTYEAFKGNFESSTKAGKTTIVGINELMKGRTEYLLNHPLLQKEPPVLANNEAIEVEDELILNVTVDNGDRVWLMHRPDPAQPFERIEMFDDGSNNDLDPADKVFGATIKKGAQTQYYFIAENKSAAKLLPERAAKDFFELEEKPKR